MKYHTRYCAIFVCGICAVMESVEPILCIFYIKKINIEESIAKKIIILFYFKLLRSSIKTFGNNDYYFSKQNYSMSL